MGGAGKEEGKGYADHSDCFRSVESIRVRLTESRSKSGSKSTSQSEGLNSEKTSRFVKTLSKGKDCWKSEAGLYRGMEI
jgi:hypothetical protein